MDPLGVVILISFWISVAVMLLRPFKDIDRHGFLMYGCLLVVMVVTLSSSATRGDIGLWFNFFVIAWAVFVNTSKFGRKYQQKVKNSLGKWLYLIHLIFFGFLSFITWNLRILIWLDVVIGIYFVIIDYRDFNDKKRTKQL